ncbi:TIGR03089 family protein [Aeromicrobium chenweiae]|uniref:TIGR03089 family protein n=1 Tax=Aeromicrobium chenweiae TaxID=2079793 RepID=A0A2S0WNV8_9ACTN|nr:TIGR03089 family protein [Aeromicrobium chenweiae]AWB93028.1 TIGR03089 family protein [Aeromicrobium chenweiae]TGN34018.1 TIGR03089 family protein [Aeromicrobium chenweiae]
MRTLDQLLRTSADPSQPLLTYYDMSTGERVELSTITTANWVAKTSNFLVDELEVEPGARIRIGLPSHWLTAVWILSAWNVGAAVVDSGADIGLSGPELLADEPVRVAASLRPLGGRFASPPEGFLDLGAEVPGHGDRFVALDPPQPSTLALDLDGVERTHADLLTQVSPDDTRRVVAPGSLVRDAELLVAACLGGGSLVVVASATPEQISRVAAQEGGRAD